MARTDNQEYTAGIDEAGRGALAGPVVAAAVILAPDTQIDGIADSKSLSPEKRARLAVEIRQKAIAWSVGLCWQDKIDRINILQATFEAMAHAAARLRPSPASLEIDGNFIIPGSVLGQKMPDQLPAQKAIVKGDQKVRAISAASIIAKTWRDRLMIALAQKWPLYGFADHKGYGTAMHLQALATHGPCPLHRLSFRGVLNQKGQRPVPMQRFLCPESSHLPAGKPA